MGRPETAVVIGREDAFARLAAARQRAKSGNGSCLLVTGEPGAGKSHLLSAAEAAWREDGALVLVGACESFAPDELAYGPFVQAWSGVAAAHGGGFGQLLAALARLGELPAEVARAWLFDRVARHLDELATGRAVAVVLEDVHWADRATLALLRFLARAAHDRRWLLVATARSDGADGLGAADELVDLVASGQVERVVLDPLPPSQIRMLAVRLLGKAYEEDVVGAIVARAGGNPYLAHELAAAARQGMDGLPSTLRRVLLRRIAAHGEVAEIALATVALAGEAPAEVVDAALAASVGGDMAGTVSALLRSGLLVPGPSGGSVRLRHLVLGEVAVGQLPAARLREAHRALAVAWAGDPAAARHWERAGELRRAFHDWLAAGRAAGRSSAYSTAAYAYSRVLELAGALQLPERQPAELALEAADVMHRAGDEEHAIRVLRSALASEQLLDDAQRLALLERLQTCQFAAGRAPDAFAVIAEASTLATVLAPSRESARIVAADGSRLMFEGRYPEGAERSALAAEWAAQLGAHDILAYARGTQGVCRAAAGKVDEGLALLAEARRLASSSASVAVEARTAVNHCYVLANVSRYAECVHVGGEAIARLATRSLAHTLGAPLYYNVVVALLALGRWDVGLALCDEAEAAPVSTATIRFLALSRARIAALRGEATAAEAALGVARTGAELGQPAFDLEHAVVSVLVLRLLRRDRAALNLVRDTVRSCPGGIDRLRLCAEGLRALADLEAAGGRVRRVDDPQAARAELLDVARAGTGGWGGSSPEASILRRLCTAEAQRLHGPNPQQWAAIARDWSDLGLVHDSAYAQLRLVEALLATRSTEPAAAALLAAHQAASRLGATPLLASIEAVARRGRLPLPGAVRADVSATCGASEDRRLDLLTRREREVIDLVGMGLTNRQIARRLVISERTAAVHVSNLMAKLGVGNRVEAARVARTHLG